MRDIREKNVTESEKKEKKERRERVW